jgi:mRNA interferase MazF
VKRGDLYRVYKASKIDPKKQRVFVVVSRQIVIDSRFSTVICAPVYTKYHGLSTQVPAGPEVGLKHDSAIHCDELVSIPKSRLTNYIGRLNEEKLMHLREALMTAMDLEL